MKLRLRGASSLAILSLATLPLFASTRIVHRWVLTGLPMPKFRKMLVAGILENYLIRQELEDTMKTQLAKYGVEGVQSYMVLPPKNEMMEGELRQRIKESSLDSVLGVPTSSYTQENVIVRVECNLFDTKTEKLVWSDLTDTVYSKDFEKLGKEYA